jgi:hypothetical protein
VNAATSPEGLKSPQKVRMTLTVQGMGFDPFTVEHEEKCHTDRWPQAGRQLPVVFDANDHDRLEVQWDDVPPRDASVPPPPAAPQPAPAAQQDIHTVTWTSGDEVPAEMKGMFDEAFKRFGDVKTSHHVETKVIDLSNDPAARAQVLGPVEQMTGMDLDGDGKVGGAGAPPASPPSTAPPAPSSGDDAVSRLERLAALHRQGVLTDEEFAQQKAKLLDSI